MARRHRLLLDEHIAEHVARKLRRLGYNVTRVRSKRHVSIPDELVLAQALSERRAVVTRDAEDYLRLHEQGARHAGIVVCRKDAFQVRLAHQVHAAIKDVVHLDQQLFRIDG
jgi:uncharacterized protein with PIN domain